MRVLFHYRVLLIALLFFLSSFSAWAEDVQPADEASRLLNFAGELSNSGDYYRAITEFKRFISYYPKDPRVKDAKLGIGDSYFKAEKWNEAVEAYRDYLKNYPDGKEADDAIYNMAVSFIKMKQMEKVKKLISEVEEKSPEGELLNRLKLLMGKSLVQEGHLEDAERELAKVGSESESRSESERLAAGIKGAENLKLKSPVLAGFMSAVFPGAGQLYAGRKKDAAFSLVLNGLFTWGAIESFNRDIYVAGAILSFFELGWYSGNIYNAISDTYKYNNNVRENYFKELSTKDRESSVTTFSRVDTPGILLQVKF